jgi:hypothetical protein
MNEIMVNVKEDISTGSIRLDRSIKKIRTEIERGVKASHKIAIELNNIKINELYADVGYDDFSTFAEQYFGISKSQASRLTAVAETFLRPEFDGKYDKYSNSQLVEMLKANAAQLAKITPEMSVRAIRDLIKSDNLLIDDNGDDDNNDDNSNDSNDNSNNNGVEVLDENGEPVTDKVTKTFTTKEELMEYINSIDSMTNITISFDM